MLSSCLPCRILLACCVAAVLPLPLPSLLPASGSEGGLANGHVMVQTTQHLQTHDDCETKGEQAAHHHLTQFEAQLRSLSAKERSALDKAMIQLPSVAKDPAFRMMFLRKENYKADAAAHLFAEYWTNRVGLFGEKKAFLPMTQEGALQDDWEALSYGYMRAVPGHPRMVLLDPSRTPKKYDVDSVVRSVLYVLEKSLSQSTEMQREGAIMVLDFGKVRSFDSKLFLRMFKHMDQGFPFRPSMRCVIHASPIMSWVVNFIQFFSKEKLHVVQNQAQLQQLTGATDESVFTNVNHQSWLDRIRRGEKS